MTPRFNQAITYKYRRWFQFRLYVGLLIQNIASSILLGSYKVDKRGSFVENVLDEKIRTYRLKREHLGTLA